MATDPAPRVRSIAKTTALVPSLSESPISAAGGNYFGGCNSLFNQPLACSDLSGSGRRRRRWGGETATGVCVAGARSQPVDGLSACESHRLGAGLTVKRKLSRLGRRGESPAISPFYHDDAMGIAAGHPSYGLLKYEPSVRDGPKEQTSDVHCPSGHRYASPRNDSMLPSLPSRCTASRAS